MKNLFLKLIGLILVSMLLISCGGKEDNNLNISVGYELAPVFREFSQSVGGEDVLGRAIGEPFELNEKVYQYVVGGLLVSDPYIKNGKGIYFDDLGNQLGYYEPPKTTFDNLDGLFLNGYEVYQEFVTIFTKMGGVEIVGYPISNASYNAELGQIEQHFENLGFYLKEEDSVDIGLLPYGRIDCGSACTLNLFEAQETEMIVETSIPDVMRVPEPFASLVKELGSGFVGKPLTEVYDAGDGKVQMVFENVVLFTLVGEEDKVMLLPISELLGYESSAPIENVDSHSAYFYRVEDELGYLIPNEIFDFVLANGGFEVVGEPIQRVQKVGEFEYEQCFENACFKIEVDANTKVETVKILPLGNDYFEKIYEMPMEHVLVDEFMLNVWLEAPLVAKNATETIFVQISNEANDSLEGIQIVVFLTYPNDKTEEQLLMPLTDGDGLTEIKVGPVDAKNGSRVRYEVCLEDGSICKSGRYTIWSE